MLNLGISHCVRCLLYWKLVWLRYPYAYSYIHTHTYILILIRTHTYSYVLLHTHVCSCILKHTHTCPFILIHTIPYLYLFIYTHGQFPKSILTRSTLEKHYPYSMIHSDNMDIALGKLKCTDKFDLALFDADDTKDIPDASAF